MAWSSFATSMHIEAWPVTSKKKKKTKAGLSNLSTKRQTHFDSEGCWQQTLRVLYPKIPRLYDKSVKDKSANDTSANDTSANANSAKGSTGRMRQECECQMCECQQCDTILVRKKGASEKNAQGDRLSHSNWPFSAFFCFMHTFHTLASMFVFMFVPIQEEKREGGKPGFVYIPDRCLVWFMYRDLQGGVVYAKKEAPSLSTCTVWGAPQNGDSPVNSAREPTATRRKQIDARDETTSRSPPGANVKEDPMVWRGKITDTPRVHALLFDHES